MRNLIYLFCLVLSLSACSDPSRLKEDAPPLQSVDRKVDLQQYAGLWYEIARFPAFFQEGCRNTTAEYSLLDDSKIKVTNKCELENGETDIAKATARVVEPETNAKLKVRFEGFPSSLFEGDYWIINLDSDYQWAVVSEPEGRYLWILSRSPKLDTKILNTLIEDIERRGFKTEALIYTSTPH